MDAPRRPRWRRVLPPDSCGLCSGSVRGTAPARPACGLFASPRGLARLAGARHRARSASRRCRSPTRSPPAASTCSGGRARPAVSRTSAFRAARVSERSEDERETPRSAAAPRWGAVSDATNAGRARPAAIGVAEKHTPPFHRQEQVFRRCEMGARRTRNRWPLPATAAAASATAALATSSHFRSRNVPLPVDEVEIPTLLSNADFRNFLCHGTSPPLPHLGREAPALPGSSHRVVTMNPVRYRY